MNRLYEYYEASGGSQVIDTDYVDVFHYDPSTFYNYEQDNLSLTSLESRYDYLAQFAGFPGSQEYSGVTFVVSSTAATNPSAGVYQTAQEAVDALPRILNYPVLIELADYGELGELSIVGITCEGRGAIEIRALNYASDTQARANSVLAIYLSSVDSTTIQNEILNASSTRTGDSTFNATSWKNEGRAFAQRSPDSQKETMFPSFAASSYLKAGSTFQPYDLSTGPSTFIVGAYRGVARLWDPCVGTDGDISPSANDSIYESLTLKRQTIATNDLTTAVLYGSFFSSISIRDCNRVKLKGVLVDGLDNAAASATYASDTGLKLNNSDVLLEDFAVARCKSRGIIATNSKINCAGSLSVRQICDVSDGVIDLNARGIGIDLYNSKLVFDTSSVPYAGRHMRIVSDGAEIGVNAVNSLICGGTRDQEQVDGYSKNAGGSDTVTAHFQSTKNILGFKLSNSIFDFDGRLGAFINLSGIEAAHSKISTPQFSVDDNRDVGFKLKSSDLLYGKHADFIGQFGGIANNTKGIPFFHCDFNGINLIAENNSNVAVHPDVELFSNVGSWGGNTPLDSLDTQVSANSVMRNCGLPGPLPAPALSLDRNSRAHIIGLAYTGNSLSSVRQGAAALVTRSSNLVLQGFSDRWTAITSNDTIDAEQELEYLYVSTPLYAKGSSKISFIGPTKISRWGVDVLCEDGSETYFGPPTELVNGLDAGRFGLNSALNHTKVELHSNRSCLVASKDSKIRMFGLGATADVSSSYGPIIESNRFIGSTSGGYMAFYPNAFSVLTNGTAADRATALGDDLARFSRNSGLLTDISNQASGSTGGMCVRAVDGSDVDVELVNFKFGMPASSVSGVMYNWNGRGSEFIDDMKNFGPPSFTTDTCWIADQCCICPGDTTVTPIVTTTAGGPGATTTTVQVGTSVITGTVSSPPATSTVPTIDSTTTITLSTVSQPTTTITIATSSAQSTTPSSESATTASTTATVTVPPTSTAASTTPSAPPPTTTPTTAAATTTTAPPPTSQTTQVPTTTAAPSITSAPTTTAAPTTSTATVVPSTTLPTATGVTVQNEEQINDAGGIGSVFGYDNEGDPLTADDFALSSFGSRIHIWNISNDSRLRVFRTLLNGNDTRTESVNNNWHGPTGRWWNGAACDYYGKYGFATENRLRTSQFDNYGPFRLMVGGDGDLKALEESAYGLSSSDVYVLTQISSLEGGSPYDQVNAQGYQMPADYAFSLSDITFSQAVGEFDFVRSIYHFVSALPAFGRGLVGFFEGPGKHNGFITHARMTEARSLKWYDGELHPGFAIPPLRCDWEGYFNNRLDESAVSLFANAKHAASKKVNLLSIHKSTDTDGGISRDTDTDLTSFGVGVRSLNIFELNQLV